MSGARPERLIAVLGVLALTAIIVVAVALLVPEGGSSGGPSAAPPPGELEVGRVVRVVDGDTVVVTIGDRQERVRYVGVDAPELANADTGAPAECGAAEATEANRLLVLGVEMELERDVSDRDRFGRLLRHAWIGIDDDRVLVTERLVVDGAIEARSYPPDTRHDARLDAAEREARTDGAGIWGRC